MIVLGMIQVLHLLSLLARIYHVLEPNENVASNVEAFNFDLLFSSFLVVEFY